MFLEQNIKGLCEKYGLDFQEFLSDFTIEHVHELNIFDIQALCEEYEIDMQTLFFKRMYITDYLQEKINDIKLLVLDVDGVMTDGGMYFTENGDQFKKFNTKDGLAIIHLTKKDFQVAIISAGFTGDAVKTRAKMLGIQNVYVGRDPKMQVLTNLCDKLGISLKNVALIGDDVNDLEMMKNIGLAVCPKNAVSIVKNNAHIILNNNGGEACVREFIDNYLLESPISE